MPVTSVTLSPTSGTTAIGSFIDLTATVQDTGVAMSGQTVTIGNSNTSSATAAVVAQTAVGGTGLSSLNLMTLSTPGGNSPRGVTVGRATETAGTGQHIAYINNGSGAFTAAVNETVSAVAEVQLVGTNRKFVQLFFYDATNGTLGAWFDLTNGTLVSADTGVTGIIAPSGSGTGYYLVQIRRTYTSAVTLAAGLKTSDSTSGTPNESFTGSTSVYINVGAAWFEKTSGVVTNASGQVTIRVRGLANGNANITGTAGSITSTASAISVGAGGSTSTNPTISGTVQLPSSLAGNGSTLTSITASPTSLSLLTSSTATITVTGSDGNPVVGATATSSNTAVATVSATTNASGQATVTWVSGGSVNITFLYNDPNNGPLTVTVPVSAATASPGVPTNLTAFATASPPQVLLTWTDNSTNETAFIVEKSTAAAGPFTQLTTTTANTATATDTAVTAGLTYYYRVKSQNAASTSNPSTVVSVAVPFPDTSGRGGFNRGRGGPGTSYGTGNLPLSRCPICSCLRNCST